MEETEWISLCPDLVTEYENNTLGTTIFNCFCAEDETTCSENPSSFVVRPLVCDSTRKVSYPAIS